MHDTEERRVAGLDYLAAVTALLQRGRSAHPTKGLYEPGEVSFWWGRARPTDTLDQLFWFDDTGLPIAGAVITQWDGWVAMDPIVMPDATPEWVAHVVASGLAHATASGFETVQLEVDRDDQVLIDILTGRGFVLKEAAVAEAWLLAADRPEISSLHDGYRLATRVETANRPHQMVKRGGPDAAERLLQTPLYRQDLDLVVLDDNDAYASYGLFWFDPVSSTGAVEPMRTEDEHQKRGLARHVLTAGVDRLAQAGAERIKIAFFPTNTAASKLYQDVGFQITKLTDTYAGPTI